MDGSADTVIVKIRTGADTGVATGVVKLRTVCSVKQRRSANCLWIPAKRLLR